MRFWAFFLLLLQGAVSATTAEACHRLFAEYEPTGTVALSAQEVGDSAVMKELIARNLPTEVQLLIVSRSRAEHREAMERYSSGWMLAD